MGVREWREPLLEIVGIPETRGSITVPRERDAQLAYRQMARGLREPTFDEAVAMLQGELWGPFWVDVDMPCRIGEATKMTSNQRRAMQARGAARVATRAAIMAAKRNDFVSAIQWCWRANDAKAKAQSFA